ncbi:hypothetical protein TcWFU_007354 [Taenia crassiceps]|uniref:Uncharacterized protein n=1 Tax=Taenia crassiceps TaxID=6207 RepID=A0ABR4Q261_9CEST
MNAEAALNTQLLPKTDLGCTFLGTNILSDRKVVSTPNTLFIHQYIHWLSINSALIHLVFNGLDHQISNIAVLCV